jgi:rhodanese-related sulfurtransferase
MKIFQKNSYKRRSKKYILVEYFILDEKNLKKLTKGKIIFLICYVGHTSSQILTLLKLLGYNVTAIKFGYGISPVKGIPVAGWLDYGLPVESCK